MVLGCEDTIEPAPPQVVLAFDTDLRLANEIDAVRVTVTPSGSDAVYDVPYDLGFAGLKLPATLTVPQGSNPDQLVAARFVGSRGGVERVRRDIVFKVPSAGVKLLRVPLEALCVSDKAAELCASGQTCIAGTCQSSLVDTSTLEDYSADKVFGGANSQCFETDACLESGVEVTPIQADKLGGCFAALPAGTADSMNIGMVRTSGSQAGCLATGCVTPLRPAAGTGWELSGSTIKFPDAVCTKVAAKEITVVRSSLCQKLTPEIPLCSEGTSVTGTHITPSNPPQQKGYAPDPLRR